MALSLFAAFWVVSILLIMTPGADWAYAISAGVHGRGIVPAVAGLLCGHFIATIVVAAGVGALVASHPAILTVLIAAGAAYLLWLGINLFTHPPAPEAGGLNNLGSWQKWMMKGIFVSGMNPKVFLLFLALLPQFTDPTGSWPMSLQMIMLGLMHIVSCGTVYLIVGFSARAVLQTRPKAAQLVSRFSGAAMITIALLLFSENFI